MESNKKNLNIIIKNLSYAYKNKVVFSNTSVNFNPSDITVIIGNNGEGKTTLAYLMLGVLNDADNAITTPYKNPMCTFQNPILLNRTVYKNILHSATALKTKSPDIAVEKSLKAIDLWEQKDMPATLLSGGQKMRLQIGRMIASDSKLWILDEPYAGLDLKSTKALDKIIINAKKKGIKILIITHSLDVINRLANTIVEIKNKTIHPPIKKSKFLKSIQ